MKAGPGGHEALRLAGSGSKGRAILKALEKDLEKFSCFSSDLLVATVRSGART